MTRRVQIHWSFIMLAAVMVSIGQAGSFALFVISVTLHELAHVIAVKIFGGRVKSLRLIALGEVAVVSGLEEMDEWRRYTVYFSGPLLSLLLGCVSFLLGWRNTSSFNLLVGFLNLMPVLPLDGGRVTQLFLWNRLGILRGNRYIARLGRIAGNAVIIAGIIYAALFPCNISLLCVGMYVKQWNKRALIPLMLEFYTLAAKKPGIKKGVVPIRLCAVYSDTPVSRLVERVQWDSFTHAVIDNEPQSLLREGEFMAYVLENGLNCTVGTVWEQSAGKP